MGLIDELMSSKIVCYEKLYLPAFFSLAVLFMAVKFDVTFDADTNVPFIVEFVSDSAVNKNGIF